jgi:hypothetical protein
VTGALLRAQGNAKAAAASLGISRATLHRKICSWNDTPAASPDYGAAGTGRGNSMRRVRGNPVLNS